MSVFVCGQKCIPVFSVFMLLSARELNLAPSVEPSILALQSQLFSKLLILPSYYSTVTVSIGTID